MRCLLIVIATAAIAMASEPNAGKFAAAAPPTCAAPKPAKKSAKKWSPFHLLKRFEDGQANLFFRLSSVGIHDPETPDPQASPRKDVALCTSPEPGSAASTPAGN